MIVAKNKENKHKTFKEKKELSTRSPSMDVDVQGDDSPFIRTPFHIHKHPF